jgi:hypothetical protein
MTRRLVRPAGAVAGLGVLLAAPASATAHQLAAVFQSRLPLVVYVGGAAAAVALSFAIVLIRDLRAATPLDDGRRSALPGPAAVLLRAAGLAGLAWIAAQAIVGGDSDAEVSRLFAWVYGWVGLAIVSAFGFPVWAWLSPFATLHDLGAALIRRTGGLAWSTVPYPARLGRWPAVVGFAAVVWLELVASGASPRTLGIVILGYTGYTLAMMAQFGRDAWLANGEIFAVWFGLLGRIAPWVADADGRLRRRGFARGLLEPGWSRADLVLVGLGTGSILFDGLSQTAIWVGWFGLPAALPQTLLLVVFLGVIVGAALLVSRVVGIAGTGAGLLPIAVGYLIAHYLTYLVIDGQRIVIAVSDPLQKGWDLFGTAFFEPSGAWLPPALVWTVQLLAVVGGHVLGAWGGHVTAAREAGEDAGAHADSRALRLRQVPLAIVMVGLTSLTLWSLGQALFVSGA